MLKQRNSNQCDYCEKQIEAGLEVCSVCIHNMRELQKDRELQQITIDEHTMEHVVKFEKK